jgi:glutamate N-acetyltransferase/amino-acid N-acetyltransferase
VDRSFNRITVDGDTSTNDTVLVMTSGTAAATVEHVGEHTPFQQALDDLLMRLARACVKDGEGATKLVEICVKGAGSDAHARRVAETIANSSLVKTALFGEDANWGRILAAAGRAGVDMEPDRVDLFFDDIQMVSRGAGCGKEIEAAATAVLKKPEFTITVDLNAGPGRSAVLTCDLSLEYVRINADYRT